MSLYTKWSASLKALYPFPVFKIPLNAGFTCPNRDGTKGAGGCVYCDNRSFAPNARGPREELAAQLAKGKERYRAKKKDAKFVAYFQAYTNTYGSPDELRETYAVATRDPDVVGLSIGTRPDCVADDVLDLVASLRSRDRRVWLELGLESAHDPSLRWMNRCHTAADFADAARRAAARGLPVVAHVILGIPGETRAIMRDTARFVAGLPVDSVKIHHLYVCPHTELEKMWIRGEAPVPTLAEHAAAAADFLEILPERVSVQRLIGELPGPYCVAPDWGVDKARAVAAIEDELRRRGARQGCRAPQPAAAR
jgi:hypothetical protein